MPRNQPSWPELLTGTQARQLAGITTTAWLELLETDQLPKPIQVGGRFKWRKADVMQWIRELRTTGVFS